MKFFVYMYIYTNKFMRCMYFYTKYYNIYIDKGNVASKPFSQALNKVSIKDSTTQLEREYSK